MNKNGLRRFFSLLLAVMMVCALLPTAAFAEDIVEPQDENGDTAVYELDTGHSVSVRFTVLYVGNEFNMGYNYGSSESTEFVCQYSTPHSDTAYSNHTIAISDIKAAADRASVNSGYQIVGWTKAASANPSVYGFNLTAPTACNKGDTIYLVAKNPNPQPDKAQ